MAVTFSNPRLRAEFGDWPSGRERVKCVFQVHRDKRGYRVERSTTNKHGAWCKPKYSTYQGQSCIVDGSDGRTYLLQAIPPPYGTAVKIMDHAFMSPHELGHDHHVYESADPALFKALLTLILQSGAITIAIKE